MDWTGRPSWHHAVRHGPGITLLPGSRAGRTTPRICRRGSGKEGGVRRTAPLSARREEVSDEQTCDDACRWRGRRGCPAGRCARGLERRRGVGRGGGHRFVPCADLVGRTEPDRCLEGRDTRGELRDTTRSTWRSSRSCTSPRRARGCRSLRRTTTRRRAAPRLPFLVPRRWDTGSRSFRAPGSRSCSPKRTPSSASFRQRAGLTPRISICFRTTWATRRRGGKATRSWST